MEQQQSLEKLRKFVGEVFDYYTESSHADNNQLTISRAMISYAMEEYSDKALDDLINLMMQSGYITRVDENITFSPSFYQEQSAPFGWKPFNRSFNYN